MTLYAAIDLHSNNSVLCVLDETDRIVFSKRLPNDLAKIEQALRGCPGAIQGIAIESTYNWYWLVDGLQDAGFTIHLVNTCAVKQSSRPKLDGKILSQKLHDSGDNYLDTRRTSQPTILRLYRSRIRYRWNHRPTTQAGR